MRHLWNADDPPSAARLRDYQLLALEQTVAASLQLAHKCHKQVVSKSNVAAECKGQEEDYCCVLRCASVPQ
jgi:hypothetical protein